MSNHNLNEAALAATLGKAAGMAGKAGKVMRAAGAASKVAKKASSLLSGGSNSVGTTDDRVSYKAQAEELEVACDYLIDNGFVDTAVQAEAMYEHMTEDWKTYILNS